MKRVLTATVFLSIISTIPIYGQEEDLIQSESAIKLDVVWTKEFDEGIVDVALYEENLMPRVIITGDDAQWGCKGIYFFDKDANEIFSRKLWGVMIDRLGNVTNSWAEGGIAKAVISRNGRYVGILEPKEFAEKERNPVGFVEIIDNSGAVLNRFPVDSWYYWVSPYGDEVISAYPAMDIPIFNIWNNHGKKTVDLSKTSYHASLFGDSLKAIAWRGAEAVENLVAVYDATLKSPHKSFAIPSTSRGYTYSHYFLLTLPKRDKFALSTRSEFIKLYTYNGKLLESIEYAVGGGAILSSPNNRYLCICLRDRQILYDLEIGKETARSNQFFSPVVPTNNAELLALKDDSFYLASSTRMISTKVDIPQIVSEERLLLQINSTRNRICVVSKYGIAILEIQKP